MNVSPDPFLGKIIRGYILEELLERGAMSAVYRARAEKNWLANTLIATILIVPETFSTSTKQRFQERFLREAERLETLRHSNILSLYSYGEQDGYCYLLAPDVEGETLLSAVKRRRRWTPQEVLFIFTPIAAALEYLHSQGLVYPFFSPANVLLLDTMLVSAEPVQLTMSGLISMVRREGFEGYLTDTADAHLKSIAGIYLGAPEYLAPEIVRGSEWDTRADVYALGILLYTLLSGAPPFTGENYQTIARKHTYELLPSLHEVVPDLPVALELVLNHALHRHPDFRFQRPQALVTAFMHVINERIHAPNNLKQLQKLRGLRAIAAPTSKERPTHANDAVEISYKEKVSATPETLKLESPVPPVPEPPALPMPEPSTMTAREAHAEIATMTSQIQQLKQRLLAQAKTRESMSDENSFPHWLT